MKLEQGAVLVTVLLLAVIVYVKAVPLGSGGAQVAQVVGNFLAGIGQIVSALTGGGGKPSYPSFGNPPRPPPGLY